MQNTVYERKQNGVDFILLHSVTTVHFGNRVANVLVTEQPQYSVPFCIFSHLAEYGNLAHFKRLTFYLHLPAFPCTAYHFPRGEAYVRNAGLDRRG